MKYLFSMCMVALLTVPIQACSNDNETSSNDPVDESGTDSDNAGTTDSVTADYHFDLTITVGSSANDEATIMRSVSSLDSEQGVIRFTGEGYELVDYTEETILKGKYYYQVPVSNDRFVKLLFKDNQMTRLQEQKFAEGYTYSSRKYTHAWINDNTLVVMAANGDANKIIWTKLNADDLTILANGTLDIALPDGYTKFTTSGVLTYRESDNKLFYFYYGKNGSLYEPYFHVVVINPDTMEVESDKPNSIAEAMTGSAYGELLQNFVLFDDADNLYMSVFNNSDNKGLLLRINAGEFDFDSSYNGFPNAEGKLVTVQYVGNNKALAYSCDNSIDSDYCYYYSIIDLPTGTRTHVKYNGTEIPYNYGRFAQRSCVVDGKAYFGVNVEGNDNPQIYIYDAATDSVTKGAEVEGGYVLEEIRVVQD